MKVNKSKILRKPHWLKINLPNNNEFTKVNEIVKHHELHTICQSGNCPNMGECWGRGTATFLILGEICTRSCKFCAVKTGKPKPPDKNEPIKVARSVKLMKLKHCVITSVDRDDLPDGGSAIWAATIKAVKELNPETTIEVLIPDFNGNYNDIKRVANTRPEVISHNLETVERLTPLARSKAKYRLSLNVLQHISNLGATPKSGIMLGLGETEEEIYQTMDDLLSVGCKVLTLGQYLQPSLTHLAVEEYVTPKTFEKYRMEGLKRGFKFVESAPLVRSSYRAEKHVR